MTTLTAIWMPDSDFRHENKKVRSFAKYEELTVGVGLSRSRIVKLWIQRCIRSCQSASRLRLNGNAWPGTFQTIEERKLEVSRNPFRRTRTKCSIYPPPSQAIWRLPYRLHRPGRRRSFAMRISYPHFVCADSRVLSRRDNCHRAIRTPIL